MFALAEYPALTWFRWNFDLDRDVKISWRLRLVTTFVSAIKTKKNCEKVEKKKKIAKKYLDTEFVWSVIYLLISTSANVTRPRIFASKKERLTHLRN